MTRLTWFVALAVVSLSAGCDAPSGAAQGDAGLPPDGGSPDAGSGLAVLGFGSHASASVQVVEIVGSADLMGPSDLAFHPTEDHELWITNRARNSMTIVFHAGAAEQTISQRTSFGASHFFASPSSLAFGEAGTMSTIQDIDTPTQGEMTPADFMGPTLWPSSAALFDGGHASHLDMLHNSPSGAGIAWDHANAFWIFDGYHHAIAMYDFRMPHEPGGSDHSDGIIQRWADGEVGYVHGVGSHIELDRATGLLYIADTGHARVVVLDTWSGTRAADLMPNYDGADMYAMDSLPLTTLVASGLTQPSGLALRNNILYVTDHALDTIHAYDLDGHELDYLDLSSVLAPASIGGIDLDVEGRIYVTDTEAGRVVRIAPRL